MAQLVRRDGFGDASGTGVGGQDFPERLTGHAAAEAGQKVYRTSTRLWPCGTRPPF